MLGATIHDVAQVVGAGYAVSEEAGNAAVIVKLFRVFLLLPVVLAVGWWFTRAKAATHGDAKVPVPVFALVFLALCLLNSVIGDDAGAGAGLRARARRPGRGLALGPARSPSRALGLGTSLGAMARLGWRHVATGHRDDARMPVDRRRLPALVADSELSR